MVDLYKEEAMFKAFKEELPEDKINPLMWCIMNRVTIAKIVGLTPCQPEEWEVIELAFLRMKMYDLLYAMILHRLLQGGSEDLEADVRKSMDPLLCDGLPEDSLESLRWCVANQETIRRVIDKRPLTQAAYADLLCHLTVHKRYELLFFTMVRDTINEGVLKKDLSLLSDAPCGGGND